MTLELLAERQLLREKVEKYEKAIENMRKEIKDLHNSHMINFVSADGAVDTCLEIIDKHIGGAE